MEPHRMFMLGVLAFAAGMAAAAVRPAAADEMTRTRAVSGHAARALTTVGGFVMTLSLITPS